MGTVPSADRISSIESVTASGAKWTVPDFFTAPGYQMIVTIDEPAQSALYFTLTFTWFE